MRDSFQRSHWLGLLSGLLLAAASPAAAVDPSPPWIGFSTYLGGSNDELEPAVAVSPGGSVYVGGITFSPDFPILSSSQADPACGPFLGCTVVFLTGFEQAGNPFYSLTFDPEEFAGENLGGVAVDSAERPYLIGTQLEGGESTAFLAEIPLGGGSPSYPARWAGRIQGRAVAVDGQGNVYTAILDHSENPDTCESCFAYLQDVVVEKRDAAGHLAYSKTLNGFGLQDVEDLAVDAAGNAYVVGSTTAADFPTVHAARPSHGALSDAFVTKLAPDGSIVYSTFLGGSGVDEAHDAAVAPDGTLYVAGITSSPDFPVIYPLKRTLSGPYDMFLTKLSPAGWILFSTYLGGSGSEDSHGLAVAGPGDIYLGSSTGSSDSPLLDPTQPGCRSALVTRLDLRNPRIARTVCLPGAEVLDVAADSVGNAYATGRVTGPGFPVVNAYQPAPRGGSDAFLTQLRLDRPPDCSRAFADPGTLRFPDGRFVGIAVRNVIEPENDPLTITVTGIRQDEPLSQAGVPDASGVGTSRPRVRVDRREDGDGRVYHIAFQARDAQGNSCTGSVLVCVPHDQTVGAGCGDGGPLVDSTQP